MLYTIWSSCDIYSVSRLMCGSTVRLSVSKRRPSFDQANNTFVLLFFKISQTVISGLL